jgi:hypothetical protein
MDNRLHTPLLALRAGIGLAATLAGVDKFFNLLADWEAYLSPAAAAILPVSTSTFMNLVGVIEIAVGVTILAGLTRAGAYVASGWLLAVAANLAFAGFFDIAVRDVVMALAAFTLARLAEVAADVPVPEFNSIVPVPSTHRRLGEGQTI